MKLYKITASTRPDGVAPERIVSIMKEFAR